MKAHPQLARPIQAVVFDLVGTLLWGNKGHWNNRASLYRRIGGLRRKGMTRKRIEQAIRRAKQDLLKVETSWPTELYYPVLNLRVLELLDPKKFGRMNLVTSMDLGWEIRLAILSQHMLYHYPPPIGKMLAEVGRLGIPKFLGTNHETPYLDRLLDVDEDGRPQRFRSLGQHFPVHKRFTPHEVGVHKPDPDFLRGISAAVNVPCEHMVYVGNSPTNDVPMRETGAQVILLDHDGHYQYDIASPAFQERHGEAMERRELLVINSPARLARVLAAAYRAEL